MGCDGKGGRWRHCVYTTFSESLAIQGDSRRSLAREGRWLMCKDADGMILCPRRGWWNEKRGHHGRGWVCKALEVGERNEV